MNWAFVLLTLLHFHCVQCVPFEKSLHEGLDQLDSRFVNQFELHSKIDFIQQGITQHVKGRLHTRSDNFNKIADETGRQLNKFFEQKVSAVQRIVESAEAETSGLNYDEIFVNNEDECESYQEQINDLHLYNTPIDTKVNRSGVHIAVESFKCDNSVVRDFEWTGMKKIESAFVENSKKDRNLLRQYIGSYTGLTRVYPAFLWEREPLLSVDLFDPRFRPWFIGAESAPKDIMFLLDYSGSVKGQHLHLMKIAIMHILATLNPNDYINAIWYNNRKEYMFESCDKIHFFPATTQNKRLFQDFLGKIEERDQATLPPALNMSFDKFVSKEYTDSERQNHTSGGHQLVFLFTDGIEYWPMEEVHKFKTNNPDKKVRVFGYEIGRGTGEIKALRWVCCETSGGFSTIDSISNVKMQTRTHFSKLSEPLAYSLKTKPVSKRPVAFSFPYMDTQSEGGVFTISAPIINRMFTKNGSVNPEDNNSFIGVAGVDMSLERLRLMLPNTDQIKSFIIDNNGVVIFHPKLNLPAREIYSIRRTACHTAPLKHRTGTRVQFGPVDERIRKLMGHVDSIPTLDLLEIETELTNKFYGFRNAMVRGDCSKAIDDNDKQYKCLKIANTPFTVGFVLHKNKEVLELDERVEKTVYEENELVADWVREPVLCSEFLSADDKLERFESLIDMAEKKADCLSSTHQAMLSAFSRAVSEWRTSWPIMEENMTCDAHLQTDNFYNSHRASFVEYAPGIVSFYPKCQFSEIQSFFSRRPQILDSAIKDRNTYLYVDPLTKRLTFFRAIIDNVTQRQIALVGAQFLPSFMNSIWLDLLSKSNHWQLCKNTKGKCYVVTRDSYILASSNTKHGVMHLAEKEPLIFDQLISMNAIKSSAYLDYQARCHVEARTLHPHTANPASSAIRTDLMHTIRRLVAMIYSWLTLDMFGEPEFVEATEEEECQFKIPDMTEQCVMKWPHFEININKTLTIQVKPKRNCVGNATIVPSSNRQLYALVVEANCQNTYKAARYDAVSKHLFMPTRVSECNLVKRRVRYRRENIDYNVTYPLEQQPECSNANIVQLTFVALVLASSILFLPLILI